MNQSEMGKLNWKDYVNGIIMAIVPAALVVLQQVMAGGITKDEWQLIIAGAIAAAVTYLTKNVFTDRSGDNPGTDAVGKRIGKK